MVPNLKNCNGKNPNNPIAFATTQNTCSKIKQNFLYDNYLSKKHFMLRACLIQELIDN